jgi:lipoate-protein ligase A
MKQTAVDWLEFEITRRGPKYNNPPQWLKELYEQAKEMEKQQIEEAFNQGYRDGESDASNPTKVSIDVSEFANAEEYYNEIFKSNESNHYTRFTNEGKLLKY